MRNSDSLTFNSNFESRAFEQAVGKITIPKITIPIGIEISPEVKDSSWDRELRLSYFGHLIKRKRADRLLNLAKEITNNYPDIDLKVSIVGEGDEERNLRKLSESLGLDDVVQWHGFMQREKMIESLADSTFFVLLSDFLLLEELWKKTSHRTLNRFHQLKLASLLHILRLAD